MARLKADCAPEITLLFLSKRATSTSYLRYSFAPISFPHLFFFPSHLFLPPSLIPWLTYGRSLSLSSLLFPFSSFFFLDPAPPLWRILFATVLMLTLPAVATPILLRQRRSRAPTLGVWLQLVVPPSMATFLSGLSWCRPHSCCTPPSRTRPHVIANAMPAMLFYFMFICGRFVQKKLRPR